MIDDFDFLIGRWSVLNRRLTRRLAGSTDWEEFPATAVCRSLLGGAGNIDEIIFPTKGTSGLTLRLFDRVDEEWSLHWTDSRTGRLFPPVVGGFDSGTGLFHGHDDQDGVPVLVRFTWRDITSDSAHWEQAFSTDSQDWEVNWTMTLSRIE